MEDLIKGDAEFWYTKVNQEKFTTAAQLLGALKTNFKRANSKLADRKRLEEVPFKSLDDFLHQFMSAAAYVDLDPEEVAFFLLRRLQGKYARAVEAKLEAGETNLMVIVAAVRTLAEAAQDDAKAKDKGKAPTGTRSPVTHRATSKA